MTLAALFVATVLAIAPSAQAQQTIGTNLGAYTPNANFNCTVAPGFVPFPTGVGSCTYVSTLFGPQSTMAPATGVITRVRVKAAAPTGRMQVVVARQIGTTTSGIGCCFWAGESQVFTPRPNSVTAVNVRLPVENFDDPVNGIQVRDLLGLSVLEPGAAIPGQIPGRSELEGSLGFFPRIARSDSISGRVDGGGYSLVPLLNADFTPLCGAGLRSSQVSEEQLRAEGDAAVPIHRGAELRARGRCLGGASPRAGSLAGSRAGMRIDCNLARACRGSIALLPKRGKGKLGAAKFRVPSGSSRQVKVKLTKKGKRAARGKRKVAVRAKIKVAGGPNQTSRLELKR